MTYSAVLGVFLLITALILNITARNSLKKTIISNLYTESATIEELYRDRIADSLAEDGGKDGTERPKEHIKSWFHDIKKLSDIGFSSDIALVLRTDDKKYGIFTPGESQSELDFQTAEPEELQRWLRDESVFFSITGGNTSYYAVSRPLSDNAGGRGRRAWIITYTPVYELNHLVKNMNLKAAYAIAAGLLAAALLSWYLSNSISRPIKTLKAHAERIASRDFKSRADIRTEDEIESLGQAMNKIAGDLNDYDLSQRRFLQNVSHELKTPVMSIMGYAEAMRDGVIDNNEKALDVMIGECRRLQRLVNEVLYLSKLETVEEFYSFQCEKLNGVIGEARDKMQTLMDKAGIGLALDLDKDCAVNMDRDKLLQAVLNLLSNALRYAKSRIVIETRLDDKNVSISIWDDGPGMDANEPEHVFERFYKGKKGNSGLGMTITKAIVEKHKGTITASNKPGAGALFMIVLPVRDEK